MKKVQGDTKIAPTRSWPSVRRIEQERNGYNTARSHCPAQAREDATQSCPNAKSTRAAPFAFTRCAGCSKMSCITSEGNLLSTRSYICLNFVFKDLLITPIPQHLLPPPAEPLPPHPSSATEQISGKEKKRWKPCQVKVKEEKGCTLKMS